MGKFVSDQWVDLFAATWLILPSPESIIKLQRAINRYNSTVRPWELKLERYHVYGRRLHPNAATDGIDVELSLLMEE